VVSTSTQKSPLEPLFRSAEDSLGQNGPLLNSGYGTVGSSSPSRSEFLSGVSIVDTDSLSTLANLMAADKPSKLICPTCHKAVNTYSELK
jgi:hypothetical protein